MIIKKDNIIKQDEEVNYYPYFYSKVNHCPISGNTFRDFEEEQICLSTTFIDKENDITFTVHCDGCSDRGDWFDYKFYTNDVGYYIHFDDEEYLEEQIYKKLGVTYDAPKVDKFAQEYRDSVKEQVIERTKNEYFAKKLRNREELNIPVEVKEAKIIDDKLITSFQSKIGKDSVLIVIDKENKVDVVNSATLKKIASDNNTSKDSLLERMTDLSKANHYANKDKILESSKKALNKNEVDNTLDQDVKAKRKFKR
ncbi:hypothetical protein L0991_03640 [Vibrio chagasii]|uniref:hypothetical protein n=1 Tax=Vibrio chagasii TaxID=170679 RepID=UPI0035A744F7